MGIGASAHRWADMLSGRQAVQCTNIFCISLKVYFRHYINGHVSTRQYANMLNVSCADFITSLLLGWLHHRADALMRRCADVVTWLFQQCLSRQCARKPRMKRVRNSLRKKKTRTKFHAH